MSTDHFRRTGTDAGISLVELIVVISIMAVMTGLITIGVSMMFSKDAESVGKTIDDTLSEARMLAMSRDGEFEMVLNIDDSDPSNNNIVINRVAAGTSSEYKTIAFKKEASIEVTAPGMTPVSDGSVAIVFDKGNGSVKSVGGSAVTSGVCSIKATASRLSTRTSTVQLIVTTGRHYLE